MRLHFEQRASLARLYAGSGEQITTQLEGKRTQESAFLATREPTPGHYEPVCTFARWPLTSRW